MSRRLNYGVCPHRGYWDRRFRAAAGIVHNWAVADRGGCGRRRGALLATRKLGLYLDQVVGVGLPAFIWLWRNWRAAPMV